MGPCRLAECNFDRESSCGTPLHSLLNVRYSTAIRLCPLARHHRREEERLVECAVRQSGGHRRRRCGPEEDVGVLLADIHDERYRETYDDFGSSLEATLLGHAEHFGFSWSGHSRSYHSDSLQTLPMSAKANHITMCRSHHRQREGEKYRVDVRESRKVRRPEAED